MHCLWTKAAVGAERVPARSTLNAHPQGKSWFLLDLISVIPVDTIMMGINTENLEVGPLKMIRMLRLLRLVKLAKILRASHIFARWENLLPASYSSRELLKWMAIVGMLLHWLACALGMTAQLQGTLRSPELEAALAARLNAYGNDGADGVCYGCVRVNFAASYGGRVAAEASSLSMNRFCESLSECLTPCEFDVLATMKAGVDAHPQEIAAAKIFLQKQETWVCRCDRAAPHMQCTHAPSLEPSAPPT